MKANVLTACLNIGFTVFSRYIIKMTCLQYINPGLYINQSHTFSASRFFKEPHFSNVDPLDVIMCVVECEVNDVNGLWVLRQLQRNANCYSGVA